MKEFLKLIKRLKFDKQHTIIILGFSLFIFYGLEKVEFRKIVLLGIILFAVFIYFNIDNIEDILDNFKKKKKDLITRHKNIKSDKEINIDKKIQNFKIKNPSFTKKAPKINKLKNYLKKLDDFIKVNYKEIIFSYGETLKKTLI